MPQQRFYDIEPSLGKAVGLLMVFPNEMQSLIAQGVSRIAEQEFKAKNLMQDLKSLGSDIVMSLHKSKQRKRGYDRNREVHETLNYLMILSPKQRYLISLKILGLLGTLQQYLKLCRLFSVSPPKAMVATLVETYVKNGEQEAQVYLKAIETELLRTNERRGSVYLSTEEIMDDVAGLKLREEI